MPPHSHNAVNLDRLVTRLERDLSAGLEDASYWTLRRLNEDAKHARELLQTILGDSSVAQSSSFSQYDQRLNKISMDLILALPTAPPLPASTIYEMPDAPQTSDPASFGVLPGHESLTPANGPMLESTSSIASSHVESTNATQQNGRHTFEDALSRSTYPPLQRSNLNSPELPPPALTPSEQLLGRRPSPAPPAFARSQTVDRRKVSDESSLMGSTSKLHDDLTEQLAQMSTQLRRNAQHFSKSLEDEKPLIDESAGILESNVARLTASAGRLGQVSSGGRSNTWLVVGSCLAVCVAWLWMYLIIRLT